MAGVQYEVALDTRPQFMLSGQTPVLTPAAVAKTVSDDNAGSIVGAINGLQDVKVASRVTTQGDACQLPLVYKCAPAPPQDLPLTEAAGCIHVSMIAHMIVWLSKRAARLLHF